MAQRIDPFKPCGASVFWWRIPKAKGGFRRLCRLPTVLYAASLMVKDVLETSFTPGPHLSDIKGQGRDREARRIAEALQQGYEFVYLADVTSCFDSVNLDALSQLPLPKVVIRNVLDTRTMDLRHAPHRERRYAQEHGVSYPYDDHTIERNGPRGLMQGSPASNVIISWFFNDLPGVLQTECVPFLLADDVLVVAEGVEDCREIEKTLTGYFAGHRAGPFVLSGGITTIGDGFERAGYGFRRRGLNEQDVVIEPSLANYGRILEAAENGQLTDKEKGRVEPIAGKQALNARLSGFSAMSDLDSFRDEVTAGMRHDLRAAQRDATRATDQLDAWLRRLPRGIRESVLERFNASLSEQAPHHT
ncbi:reverse transcriptase domain-containing protein [Methylobacterium sp. Leaf85]|uniref:reverse transcriptase domain-containing protein n=1 Tax=Methylobacterium sp. Leaf85 TaxID=1736241 RepID=UPI00138F2C72|nr:reverse transcriptase domain-containing protein [Methylobacterium sp. Leaf85]